jgi:hypothetical protein
MRDPCTPPTTMHHPGHYRAIFAFIEGIGLPIRETPLPGDTFLPGVELREGGILVDPARLQWPGDLLHEAGHLAVLPSRVRHVAEEDQPNAADAEHAGELEAMAWAYAAVQALEIPVDVLIHEGGYRGRSRDLLQMYAFGVYPGLKGLCDAGLAAAPGFTPDCGELRYPRMLKWLRD